jgi:uncharacterized protein (TIGR03437 family)
MKLLTIVYSFCLVLFLNVATLGQTSATVKGRILDALTATPIVDVMSTYSGFCLIPMGGGQGYKPVNFGGSAKTNSDGIFEITYTPLTDPGRLCFAPPSYSFSKVGYQFSPGTYLRQGEFVFLGSSLPSFASVSAASFREGLTSGMLATVFGQGLFSETVVFDPAALPTSYAGRKLVLQDSNGTERETQLLFVSPTQLNFLVPLGFSEGSSLVKLVNETATIQLGFARLNKYAPGLFAANANGVGVPAAVILRVRPGNQQNYEPVASFDTEKNIFVPLPIDLGAETDQVYLVLFGTGWRNYLPAPNPTAYVNLYQNTYSASFAGAAPGLTGVDQINVLIPRELAGKGEIRVSAIIAGNVSNELKINLK